MRERRLADCTRSIGTRRPWIAWILTKHVEDIAEVEADGTHMKQRRRISMCGKRRLRLYKQMTDRAAAAKLESNQVFERRH